MGKVFPSISPDLKAFIEAQPLLIVASAPLSGDGHVNLSPKGLDCLRILSPNRVAYLDLTGSGNETAAHLRENGRITFMFCGFTASSRIVRLYGTGLWCARKLLRWAESKEEQLPLYRQQKNARSIDNLPAPCGPDE